MPDSINIEEIKEIFEKDRLMYTKYAGIGEGLEEALVSAILELEKELGFRKDKRMDAIEEVEELTAGLFEYLKENSDCIVDRENEGM